MKTEFKPLPAVSVLRDRYEIVDGTLVYRWAFCGKVKKGAVAGKFDSRGYCYVRVKGGDYLAHRIVYAMTTGIDPVDFEIDHIDGNKRNNSPENLRACTHVQNQFNRQKSAKHNATTRIRNIRIFGNGYQVRITKGGRTFLSERIKTVQEAVELARSKRLEMFGEFAGSDDLNQQALS